MKAKHIKARIAMCLELSKLSNCPRRKFGSLLLDPVRNQVIGEGYNGSPRGGGELCGGHWCHRDGLKPEDVEIHFIRMEIPHWSLRYGVFIHDRPFEARDTEKQAEDLRDELLEKYPQIKSGTEIQIGCHHSEMNVICNAAANGIPTKGTWLIVTGEPCLMCSKLIHHAGITEVIVVEGGYIGANGVQYLEDHGVNVRSHQGPKDPRG